MKNRFVSILHLEDEKEWQENVEMALAGKGYLIRPARSVGEAKLAYGEIVMANQFPYHLPQVIILDISMDFENAKDTGGFEFIEELKSWGFTKKTAIIILSGYITKENLASLFRDYKNEVIEFFDKGSFSDNINEFQKTVDACIVKVTNTTI